MINSLIPIYRQPLALIGERNGRTFGDHNVVQFLSGVHPSRLPWSRGTITLPDPPAARIGPVHEAIDWQGSSGKLYTYYIYPLAPLPALVGSGNYIYAYCSGDGWVPAYIGQGDLSDRIGPNHHRWNCVIRKGATHVHAHQNAPQQARLDEEADLLDGWPNSYVPTGCNEKPGG